MAKTKRRGLTEAEKQAAANLRAIWDESKKSRLLTQQQVADAIGFETQAAVSHYLNAKIPLNARATMLFARYFGVSPLRIRPDFVEVMADAIGVDPKEIPWIPGEGDTPERKEARALLEIIERLPSSLRAKMRADADSLAQPPEVEECASG